MLKKLTLAALTLVLATTGATSLRADDRLLEKTVGGWYHSRTVRADGRITELGRSGENWIVRLDNGQTIIAPLATDVRLRYATNQRASERRVEVTSLLVGDQVRVIGRPGANGTMFSRRIDVLNADTTDGKQRTRQRVVRR